MCWTIQKEQDKGKAPGNAQDGTNRSQPRGLENNKPQSKKYKGDMSKRVDVFFLKESS